MKDRLQALKNYQNLKDEAVVYVVEEWYARSKVDNELISYRLFKEENKAIRYKEWLVKHNKMMKTNYRARVIETYTQDNISLTSI